MYKTISATVFTRSNDIQIGHQGTGAWNDSNEMNLRETISSH